MAISRLSNATFGPVQRDKDKKKPSTTDPAKKEAIEAKPVGPQPVDTWAGVFSAPDFVVGTYGPGNYGADIEITFTPKAPVDAESIALVQTNQSFLSSRTGNLEPLDDVPQPGTVEPRRRRMPTEIRMSSKAGSWTKEVILERISMRRRHRALPLLICRIPRRKMINRFQAPSRDRTDKRSTHSSVGKRRRRACRQPKRGTFQTCLWEKTTRHHRYLKQRLLHLRVSRRARTTDRCRGVDEESWP
jgi:hypothetical protein